jgi:hypothetical protein
MTLEGHCPVAEEEKRSDWQDEMHYCCDSSLQGWLRGILLLFNSFESEVTTLIDSLVIAPRSCGIGWSKDHRSSKFRLRDLREQMYDQPSGKPPPLQSISHKHLYLLHCARNISQQLVSSSSSLVTMLQISYTHIHIHSFLRFNSLLSSVFQDLKPPHLPSLFSFAFISSLCDFGHRVQYLNVRYSK